VLARNLLNHVGCYDVCQSLPGLHSKCSTLFCCCITHSVV